MERTVDILHVSAGIRLYAQRRGGYIPTEYAKVEKRDDSMLGWLNCTCAALSALAELAEIGGE